MDTFTTAQPPSARVSPLAPALTGQTKPCSLRLTRIRRSSRRQIRSAHSEQAAQQFLLGEECWREFKEQQQRDYMDMRDENRLREMELNVQRQKQAVASKPLDKLADKYCKD